MDYFSKFLRTTSPPSTKVEVDHAQEFHKSWNLVKNTLQMPDERQLTKGIGSTEVPALLRSMVDSLVWESTRIEDGGTGACLEYLLKNDVLGVLVRLSETDRPPGIQAEVLRAVSNMVVLLDEQFLVHSAVHKAVLRLLRNCVGDDLQEQLDGRSKLMGAARDVIRTQPSEHEEDLVNLLCILCSRIRTYRELLMIFFHDKHWYRSEPLFSVEEEDEEDEEIIYGGKEYESQEDEDPDTTLKAIKVNPSSSDSRESDTSPTLSHKTITVNQSQIQMQIQPESQPKKTEYEFLLFNYLLRFVHREGHIGEFARAGLLFLMDVAMSSGETGNQEDLPVADPVNDAALALAEYILDGDFSEVLGAGLSAVYSLLPSKLGFFPQISIAGSDNAMTIGGPSIPDEEEKEIINAHLEKQQSMGIEDARSPEFKLKMDHFLTLLLFLQDVLRRNVSHDNLDASALVGTAIVQSILDAVRRIFLENVLYPSVLECSDVDGSAVAVMSYIEIMVRTLRDGPLANLLVDFLVSEDNDDPQFKQRMQPVVALTGHEEKRKKSRRRQSSAMILLEMEAPESRKRSDYFTSMGRFTLKDLLLSNLKSKSQPTATSALQLLQTMLTYHPQVTTEHILVVIPDSLATAFPQRVIVGRIDATSKFTGTIDEDDEDEFFYPGSGKVQRESPNLSQSLYAQPLTTYSTHEREMALYLALISRVDPSRRDQGDNFSTGYEHYLHDALVTIQSQPVYWHSLEDQGNAEPRNKHRLNVNDPILSLILESLTTFFANTPEFNIGLTGVLATLASHPDRSTAGWTTFAIQANDESPPEPRYGPAAPDDDGDDRSIDFTIEEKLASHTNFLPAASMNDKSRPIVYTILQGLVDQLERYRQCVENFDKFLLERRQGLLFSENLTDALNLALDLSDDLKLVKVSSEPVQVVKPKPKASVSSSFVPSFLTPKKNKPVKPVALSPGQSTPARTAVAKTVSASPFGNHYKQTGFVKVEPLIASIPASGPWSPIKAKKWNAMEEDVFTSAWGETAKPDDTDETEERNKQPTVLTLSQLLDNVVILEESIKELVAIIHARRSLGIDSLRYL
ncbi:hypothetical protein HYPSUDRAFT_158290 [Hypholoma sublateritium FD-334 SS-4]|uniref:Retinoic acid induced 16-like protein-domain-containing protein n=1 Tax=Hypholoma sublateritium (strain FD-334 SS-4) TaxID=945553 RepID=A0A0D2Q6E8_HYPSF|nr:hypothetical protein HYPSUDRAFT_158290 [Hypholoma sublateritium FD-334 SS-4]